MAVSLGVSSHEITSTLSAVTAIANFAGSGVSQHVLTSRLVAASRYFAAGSGVSSHEIQSTLTDRDRVGDPGGSVFDAPTYQCVGAGE